LLKTKQNSFSTQKALQKTCKKGGILDIVLQDKTNLLPNYYQLHATFETKDSMALISLILLRKIAKH
jgi:hydroxymethylglutaryl-CoA reductase